MDYPAVIPFAAALGFELRRFGGGEAEIAVGVRPDQCNNWGVAHGGLTMTLLDVTMAHAARSPKPGQPDDGRGVVTIEMKTAFMRPGPMRLKALARVLHRTRGMAFCEGSVLDEDSGELIAHATGTFKYVDPPVAALLFPGGATLRAGEAGPLGGISPPVASLLPPGGATLRAGEAGPLGIA